MKVLTIVVIILVILAAAYMTVRLIDQRGDEDREEDGQEADSLEKNPLGKIEIDGERLVILPSSVSQERVAKTGLAAVGSEDVSHLLCPPHAASGPRTIDEGQDYRPDDAIDWVIDVRFENEPVLQRDLILELFDQSWCSQNGRPEIYGWSPEDQLWTFIKASDVPDTYTKLAFGWRLFDPISEDDFEVTTADLRRYQEALIENLPDLGTPSIQSNRSPEEAAHLAERISSLVAHCNRDVVVKLVAPRGKLYDGQKIWDVMLCLGLHWGDMDLFHWQNESSIGDEYYLDVWTSTPPGYFLPENIAAGQVRVQDLVFGYSIPRSADPESVFDSTMKAVRYAQKRLGGRILDTEGMPFDETAVRANIEDTVQRLNEAGLSPGKGSVLRVF